MAEYFDVFQVNFGLKWLPAKADFIYPCEIYLECNTCVLFMED